MPESSVTRRPLPAGLPDDLIDLTPTVEGDTAWYDVSHWGVEGRGWSDVDRYYDRLPAKAESTVRPPVWMLSRRSAGMLTRFVTDSARFRVRYELLTPNLAMDHMPATGVSGVDLYARDGNGHDSWLAVSRPESQQIDQQLVEGVSPENRLYTAYLPLYNGVESLQIGVDAGAEFRGVAPRTTKPIVFYGTSIMQGAVMSRPGRSISAILGRRFDLPTINLGFSGQGTMDPSIGELLTELDAAVYVIDCCPNLKPDEIAGRTEPLVTQLREARPETPILLVEARRLGDSRFVPAHQELDEAKSRALRTAYEKLRSSGHTQLHYLDHDQLVAPEGLVDGSHPNDLGAETYCGAYQQVLEMILS